MIRKHIKLNKSEVQTISDWFAFVDVNKRTDIDILLAARLDNADIFSISDSEAFMVLRWFNECPDQLTDQTDQRLIDRLSELVMASPRLGGEES